MANKPVTGLTVFGSNTSGTTTQLDNNFAALQDAINDFNTYANFLTDSGSANALAVTLPANITGALTNGLPIQVRIAATNSGPTVLNYNSTGNANVVNLDGSALSASQLTANSIVQLQYSNGIAGWFLQTPASSSGSGAYVLLQANQAANANQIFFNNVITSSYDQYELRMSGVKMAGNDAYVAVRVGNSNAPTFQTTNYVWSTWLTTSGGSSLVQSSGGNSQATIMPLTALSGGAPYNGANSVFSGVLVFAQPQNSNAPSAMTFKSGYMSSVGFAAISMTGSGFWNNNQAVTSLQVLPANANFVSGNFALYGIRRS